MMPADNQGVGTSTAFPDVCQTPTGTGVDVPTPYTNTGMHTTEVNSSMTVKYCGVAALTQASINSTTSGDESGVDSPIKGMGLNSLGDGMVLVDGIMCMHQLCLATGNNGTAASGTSASPNLVNVLISRLPSEVVPVSDHDHVPTLDKQTRPHFPHAYDRRLDKAALGSLMEALGGARQDRSDFGVSIKATANAAGRLTATIEHVSRGRLGDQLGLKRGDRLLSVRVDDVAIDDVSMVTPPALFAALAAPVGATVTISIARPGVCGTLTYTGRQPRPEPAPVRACLLPDGVGYVAIDAFTAGVAEHVRDAVGRVIAEGARSLIVDLRNNPGGLFDSALATAAILLPAGTPFVDGKTRDGESTCYAVPTTDLAPIDLPLFVLVNAETVSAGELLAGALQAAGRATIIGERTYGKGSGQAVQTNARNDGDDGATTETRETFRLPNGRPIDGLGITPDVFADGAAETPSGVWNAAFDSGDTESAIAMLRSSGAVDDYLDDLASDAVNADDLAELLIDMHAQPPQADRVNEIATAHALPVADVIAEIRRALQWRAPDGAAAANLVNDAPLRIAHETASR